MIACAACEKTGCRLAFYRGVQTVVAPYIDDLSECDVIARKVAMSIGLEKNDQIIIITGFGVGHGMTNTIRIIDVEE